MNRLKAMVKMVAVLRNRISSGKGDSDVGEMNHLRPRSNYASGD